MARHDPVLRRFDADSPLSVGNGELAFTADVTGLQTFAENPRRVRLGVLSQLDGDSYRAARPGFPDVRFEGLRAAP